MSFVDAKKFLEALKNRYGGGQLDLNAVQEVLQSTATEAESSGGSCNRNLNEGNLDQDASKEAVLPSISSRSCVNSSGSEGELCRKRGSTEDNEPAVKSRKKSRRVSVISSESDEDEHTTKRGERELKGKPVKSSRKSRRKSILSSESDSDEHMRRCARKDTLPIVQSSKQKNKHPVTPESEDDKPRIESGDKSDITPSDHNPKSFKRASANIELPSKRKSLKIDAGLMKQSSPGSKKQSFKKGGRRQSTSNSESNPESDVGGSLTLHKKSGCESKSENSSIPTKRKVEHKRVKKVSPSGTKSLPSTHNTTADLQDKSPKSEDLIESNADTPVKNVIRETMIESHQKKSKKSPEFKQSLYPTKTLPKTQKVSGGLQHSTKALQKQNMECEKDEKDTETSGASELDISLYVKPCSVIVPKLSKEALAELSPSKSNAIKQEKLLKEVAADTRKSESRLVPDESKVSMKNEFLIPGLPPRFASTSSVSNTKTQKKSKRTSQLNKLAKPKESRAQKDLKKPSESRIRAPITDFSDYHVPQQRLQPMDKLEQESEELDYEPLIEDDDIISICADTTIFRNYNVDDDIPEKKYTCDVDNDSVASCGSDDVARLSDVEEESYVDHLNEVPADAQDELDVKTRSEMNILAESPQKENVLGIPVEDYSCVRIRKKRDSVESGELCDEDSHSEPEKDESETNKMTENAISEMQGGSSYFETNQSNYDKESSLKLSGLKECAENLSQNIETVRKADVRGQKATPSKGKKTPSPAKKSDILGKHDSSSHLQTKRCNKEKENSPKLKSINECSRSLSKSIQTVPKGDDRRQKKTPSKANKPVSPDKDKPSINTKISDLICLENNPISNMQLEEDCHANPPPVTNQRGYKPNRVMQPAISPRNIKDTTKLDQLDIGSDQRMRKMEFPGVHFDPPKRGPLIHSPRDQGIALLKTPDIPPNSALYCRPVSVSPQEAPILTANVAPVASLNQTQSNTQLMDRPVSTFSHIMRNEGETSVPNLASSKSLPATSPSHRSLLGIQPLQEQSHGLGFRDADLCQGGSNYTSLQGPKKAVADDPENILMQYCQEYLTDGICKLEKCKKLHEFPKLTFDDGCCKQRTVDLIHKMISYPFWRKRWFSLALETLGNYGDIQIIKFLVLKFWIHKTESKTAQLSSLHDDIYWSHFGRAFALCGLGPSRCLKKILNPVLSYKKDALPNHCYHFIDNIVDALFHEYIENQSDLWNGLMELASLKDYEIPANVMREILKDTLKSPKNTVEQAEICEYLLRSRAVQPRKPEEWELMHLIHQLFMVLQRSEKNKPLAQKLADHFQISTNNKCCAAYQLSIEEANVVAVQNKRFALAPPAIPSFCNESGVYLNNNNPCNLLPRADVETTTYNQRVAPLNGPYEGAVISIPEAVNAQGVMNLKAASTSSHDLDSLESVPSTPIKSMDLKIIVGPSGNSRTVSSKAEPSPQKSSASCREQGNPNIKANPLGVEAPKSNGKGETRTVSSKVEPSPQKSSAPYREQGNPNIKANPLGVKAPKSNEKEDSFLDHLRNKRFGKASSFILCWIPNPSSMKRGIEVAITHLVSLDSKTRIEHLKTLFMAVKSRMSSSGPKDEPLKGIMIQIAVPILHNFLKEQCPIEAQAVHDILWKFTDPSSAKVQKYSPSFCKLVTAWVFIANGNVKDALDIVISNAFHSFKEHWKVPSQPTDLKLRDEVCAEIFNFCTTKDPHVEQAEKLFRLMLKAKGSYGIDVTQFFDIILRELVKLSKIQTAANLVAWAFKEYGLKPGERVNRLLLANFTAYPDNSKLSPDIVHIVQQEPYDQALPQSIEGLSRVDVCLPSVWNKIEIYSILKFLFACHLSNLPTHREIPDIAVVIKERSLSTIQGESLFSDSLDDIDPSVPAMQERVNEVIPRLLNHNKSTFENGSLVLDKQSVQDCVAEHRRDQDRGPFGQRPRPTSSRDNRPISSGRRHIDAPFLHHAPESYGRRPNHESLWGHGHPQYNAYSNDTYHNYPPPPNGRHYPRGDRYNWSRYKMQRPY